MRLSCFSLLTNTHYGKQGSMPAMASGGTLLNKPFIGSCVFLAKFRVLFEPNVSIFWILKKKRLWKLHSWNLIKSVNFVILSVKLLIYRPLNSTTHIFTCLQRLIIIFDHGQIAGVCCSNQLKNHHFVCCPGLLITKLSRL